MPKEIVKEVGGRGRSPSPVFRGDGNPETSSGAEQMAVNYRLVQSHPNMLSGDPKKSCHLFCRHSCSTMREQPVSQTWSCRRRHAILLPLNLPKVTYFVTLDKLDVSLYLVLTTYLAPLTIEFPMESTAVLTTTQACTSDLTNRICMFFATQRRSGMARLSRRHVSHATISILQCNKQSPTDIAVPVRPLWITKSLKWPARSLV